MYYRSYQKLLHALLCGDDGGENEGRGRPVQRASYEDCEFLESTTFLDKNRQEIFEGDIVRIVYKGNTFTDIVGSVPDMFGSQKIHPLRSVLERHGIQGNPDNLDVEVLGNRYETPELM